MTRTNALDPSFMTEVALAYGRAPRLETRAVAAWRALAAETNVLAERLHDTMEVSYTPHPEPYASAYAMLCDVAQGHIVVSTANSEHPVWTLAENCAFRLVHDVLGHGTTGAGFDWPGEWRAYERHASLIQSPAARYALFTEAVGQVAYAIVHCGFNVQKVAYLPQWMQWADGPEGLSVGAAA